MKKKKKESAEVIELQICRPEVDVLICWKKMLKKLLTEHIVIFIIFIFFYILCILN